MQRQLNQQKVKSLKEKWGLKQNLISKNKIIPQQLPQSNNISVNLNKLIAEISEDIGKNASLVNPNEPINQKSSDNVSEGTINCEATEDQTNQNNSIVSQRESIADGESSLVYNQKCRLFESALRKIEIDDFVLFNKLDEFMEMKRASTRKEQVKGFEAERQEEEALNQEDKDDKNAMGNIKEERTSHPAQELKNVYQQLNKMLSKDIKPRNSLNSRDIVGQTKISNYFTHTQMQQSKFIVDHERHVTIARSPKSHLKERAQLKEETLKKINNDYLNHKASLFKAKKLNKKIMNGITGIPKLQERPCTQFLEFDLSYKKSKPCQVEKENHTPNTGTRDGRLSAKKVVATVTPKTIRTGSKIQGHQQMY